MTWQQFVAFINTNPAQVSAVLGAVAAVLYSLYKRAIPAAPATDQQIVLRWLSSLLHVLLAAGPAIYAALSTGQYLNALWAFLGALGGSAITYTTGKNAMAALRSAQSKVV